MDKRLLDIDSGDVSLTLKRSSWENLFRVLEWCTLSYVDDVVYFKRTGDHWTIGNFWASIQHLQSQFKSPDTTADLTNDQKKSLAESRKED